MHRKQKSTCYFCTQEADKTFYDRRQHTISVLHLMCCNWGGKFQEAWKIKLPLGEQPPLITTWLSTSLRNKKGLLQTNPKRKSKWDPVYPKEKRWQQWKFQDLPRNFLSCFLQSLALWCLNQICPFCHYCNINNISLQFQNIFPLIQQKENVQHRHWY